MEWRGKTEREKDLRQLDYENTNHRKYFGKPTSKINKCKEKARNDKRERPPRIQGIKHYYSTNYVQIVSSLA